MTIIQGRTQTGGEKLHLLVLKGTAIIQIEDIRIAVLGYGRFADGHKIAEIVVKEDIYAENKAAGIVQKSDDINTLFTLFCGQKRSIAGIGAPNFVDVGTLIAATLFFRNALQFGFHPGQETANGRFRNAIL